MKNNFWTGTLIGAVLTAPLIALLRLGNQLFGLPFVPFDVFNWMVRVLPGGIITFGIDTMIDLLLLFNINVANTAKTAEQIIAIGQFFIGGVLAGIIFFTVIKTRKIPPDRVAGLAIGALFGFPLIAISIGTGDPASGPLLAIAWLGILFLAWGLTFIAICQRLSVFETKSAATPTNTEVVAGDVKRLNRRQFLVMLGASAATITVVGTGLSEILALGERRREEEALAGTMAHNTVGDGEPPFPNSDDPVSPVPGTRPEYTPLKDHYKVFLDLEPSELDGAEWLLPVSGMVDNPLTLTVEDFNTRWESFDQYVTLSCISGRIGTTLIGTTQWTGVSVQDVLATAQVQPEARYLVIASADGFHETVDLELINSDRRIMFCHSWDGNPLPSDHGYPLRIWIPDRFGMKQPKWITSLELTDEYREGYWVERNWSETALVRTTSVIDTVAVNTPDEAAESKILVGGIAFAGDKQISKVEVRVDGGAWEETHLRSPLSETTWVIWRYEWPYEAGEHLFEVRCYDGSGELQVTEEMPSRPDGSTGIHSREANL